MVIVSPGLPSGDLSQIQEKMYTSRKDENNILNKRTAVNSSLVSSGNPSSILSPDRIALDFSADTWRDALQLGEIY